MTLSTSFKNWTAGVCLATTLAALPARGDDLLPAGTPPAVAPVDGEGTLPPAPLVAAEDSAAEEKPLPEIAVDAEPRELTGEEPATTPAPVAEDSATKDPEVIEERYPNGSIKTVREVVQDARGNYLNHGQWKMLNERGATVMEGRMYENERNGVWNHWYTVGEVPLLRQKPYTDFQPPFVSQAIFENGELHGVWIIYDAKHRKISEIRLNRGEREGVATWWHANGRKMREMKYEAGMVNGLMQEWHPDGTLAKSDLFDQGRKLTTQTIHYGGTAKKSSGQFLEPAQTAKLLDNWEKGELATYAGTGKSMKHGKFTTWHPTGQVRMTGEYKYDVPVGTFTWLYANGQKALEGSYEEGKQEGEWSWWHDNGQRSIRGYFTDGNPSGKWTWWSKEGKVAQAGDFSEAKGHVVVTPVVPEPTPAQAEKPTPKPALKR